MRFLGRHGCFVAGDRVAAQPGTTRFTSPPATDKRAGVPRKPPKSIDLIVLCGFFMSYVSSPESQSSAR